MASKIVLLDWLAIAAEIATLLLVVITSVQAFRLNERYKKDYERMPLAQAKELETKEGRWRHTAHAFSFVALMPACFLLYGPVLSWIVFLQRVGGAAFIAASVSWGFKKIDGATAKDILVGDVSIPHQIVLSLWGALVGIFVVSCLIVWRTPELHHELFKP